MERFYKKSTGDFYSLVFFLALSITTIILDYKYNQITYVRSIINDLVVYPIGQLSYLPKTIIYDLVAKSDNLANLQEKIIKLQKENIELNVKLQELESLKDENKRLRNISKKSVSISSKKTIVRVTNNAASPNKKVVAIDKGEKDGIFVGQNVIGIHGLVGQIIETSYLSSKVILITEPSHKIPAEINRTGLKVLLSGLRSTEKLSIDFLSPNTDLKVGDIISTSGVANRFKAKIPIGKVSDILSNPEKEFSNVQVTPFENVDNMSELILIWDYKPAEEESKK